ncbi:MAG: Glycosyltransferase, group 1 family protein [Candidatus Woesebacteria bacterium GW2011_GWA1_33_30]|uniref:Glycosyltransferase, group 1 family protein n=1 Tax=Candidatus Woesebacteria bacterium GW2011_GWA2_33_28 TaxID=1618561 RepID=A0A0G0CTY4_9BACT|nr:MAG: Glycosyltransferase, group 1 family protein [Candidatus Woesebacteria bacterium GW2011_GWA2_33_28]KKP47574.1 MAG: Glycosyltransferase, group 1 family protein [Candidatus Woesebacteria bacterium GW2011_GWA1_33_30]KKP49195.1 MAG: glycosyl transferase, group 1 family protein [Microgenomates group bacterium GW2011_GWC1_33_32]KKP51687.1 MAG: Glycosyltransferase, group 1 family protein [Candidatus Woesebacteria bacterium GW2011_GWB1_33_38]KKP58468.1 MAG: Glycosyltransferase, group 1 family pr
MKIVFLTRRASPQIGGVERHIQKLNEELRVKNYNVKIISEKDIKYPHIKFIGLLYIWFWLFKNRKLILDSDIVHVHDVFIWYLPFKFLYPKKKVFLTIHGLEWRNPFNAFSLLQKRIAVKLFNGSIGVGKFLEKYIGTKFDYIIYGGLEKHSQSTVHRSPNTFLFVGRLEPDTGLGEFLKLLGSSSLVHGTKVDFVGDGSLRKECERFGTVHGFCDPTPFYKKAETVVPSGYLTYLEAKSYSSIQENLAESCEDELNTDMSSSLTGNLAFKMRGGCHGCKIKTFYSTQLKKEYWEEILKLKKYNTWKDISNVYLKLWNE